MTRANSSSPHLFRSPLPTSPTVATKSTSSRPRLAHGGIIAAVEPGSLAADLGLQARRRIAGRERLSRRGRD